MLKKILILFVYITTVFIYKTSAEYVDIDNRIGTLFPSFQNDWANLDFFYWWNHFQWSIFPIWTTNENVEFVIWSTTINCNKKITWLYFNPSRWFWIWPLDNSTLTTLKWEDTSYNSLSLTGWLYFDCSWKNYNQIHWQIKYTINWISSYLIWWLQINTWTNSISMNFSNTMSIQTWSTIKLTWFIYDTNWWLAKLSKTNFSGTSISTWIQNFSFSKKTNADLDTFYKSNIVYLHITSNSGASFLATLNWWVLYINWNPTWTTWYVSNWDSVQIEQKSSSNYNESASSTLNILWYNASFVIETKTWNINTWFDLRDYLHNKSDRFKILEVFNEIKNIYSGNNIKQKNFLLEFEKMLKSESWIIEIMNKNTNDRNKKYEYTMKIWLLNLLYWYIDTFMYEKWYKFYWTWISLNWFLEKYTAPNWKEYRIVMDWKKWWALTSPDFIIKKYFPKLKDIKKYIDNNNSLTWSNFNMELIAPNWKKYNARYNIKTKKYTTNDLFYKKYFSTLEELQRYIDSKNPLWIKHWDYTKISDLFWTKIYKTPNWKYYKIKKWKRLDWRYYFSPDFKSPKYYETLRWILIHINVRNWWKVTRINDGIISKVLSSDYFYDWSSDEHYNNQNKIDANTDIDSWNNLSWWLQWYIDNVDSRTFNSFYEIINSLWTWNSWNSNNFDWL